MVIDRWIKIKGMGPDERNDDIEACERKSNQEINAYRAEKRFRGGVLSRKNSAEDNYHNENVEYEAQNDGQDRRRNHPGVKNEGALHQCWTGKNQSDKDQASAEAHRVYTHQSDSSAEQSEQLIARAGIAHVRVEGQVSKQKQK